MYKKQECSKCKQNIEEVHQPYEQEGHNVEHSMRGELMFDDLCDDCIDDILIDMLKVV